MSENRKSMLNTSNQRKSSYEHMKSSIAEAMQPGDKNLGERNGSLGDTRPTTMHSLPPDERESILPLREDEKPLYGQRQSTEENGAAGAQTSKKDRGMLEAASDMLGKALGRE